jgi:hypothetical protein
LGVNVNGPSAWRIDGCDHLRELVIEAASLILVPLIRALRHVGREELALINVIGNVRFGRRSGRKQINRAHIVNDPGDAASAAKHIVNLRDSISPW